MSTELFAHGSHGGVEELSKELAYNDHVDWELSRKLKQTRFLLTLSPNFLIFLFYCSLLFWETESEQREKTR